MVFTKHKAFCYIQFVALIRQSEEAINIEGGIYSWLEDVISVERELFQDLSYHAKVRQRRKAVLDSISG